ncbi:Z1 domain-containing protein [Aquirufa sp. OSTEICH-129V]|uniref:Z1 domain-containing protein n=1 Tax=Aquirufa avitistagni TaxID=3104728 RepID=A0ABW6DCB8_9BACT
MNELLKKQFIREANNLLLLYPEVTAYENFLIWINEFYGPIESFDTNELEEIFPKPIEYIPLNIEEINEFGDVNTNSEYTDSISYSLSDLNEFGWLNNINDRNNISTNKFYKNIVLPSIGAMPLEVKKEIELHSMHILGRCNNPKDWQENIQGLVYGMVQSGKTASMMTLMGLAKSAGYRLFIVLSGDKESLRNQTQKRINESFNLNNGGYSNNSQDKIRSITTLKDDYSQVARGQHNGVDLWTLRDKSETIIICIKKESNNLKKLLSHLKDIEQACNQGRIVDHNFATDFKTMILDDEADFASQDTSIRGQGSTIHNLLCNIRETITQNCYVAYTATPQACIGANPHKLIGYPKDFIWLLEPHRNTNGETSSYLGLEEFFEKFPNQLISIIGKNAWPHIEKEDGIKKGIYKPDSNEVINDKKLSDIELENVIKLIENKSHRDSSCPEFKIAIIDFIIGCSIRWYRHFLSCKKAGFFERSLPTIQEIEEIELNATGFTGMGYKPFPYHSMMFNLAYINENQTHIIELINKLWQEVNNEFQDVIANNWNSESNTFLKCYQNQLEKSKRFELQVPEANSLQVFIKYALIITGKTINGTDNKYLYLINSDIDEGTILKYDSALREDRPKKASIIVGGNILSRGLTIENLSTTIFVRSQVMSLGDTNLQMCRWFGHKKNAIDLQTVYMQEHSFELFQNISESDRELRDQFKYHIFHNIPNKCLLLYLSNSPLFKSTSPSKMRNSGTGTQSYSGITVDLLQHLKHENFLENHALLENYLNKLKKNIVGKIEHNRATVYRKVPIDDFLDFFQKLKVSDDSLNISPSRYLKYLEKWREFDSRNFPDINIAIFDSDENNIPRERSRKINGVINEFKTEEDFKNATTNSLSAFRGGKSSKESKIKYCGDFLIDFPENFHSANYEIKNLRRPKSSGILFIFYKIQANYIGKFNGKKVFFNENDSGFIKADMTVPLITFSIATPLGGPIFSTRYNRDVLQIVIENSTECEKHIENINRLI